MDPIGQRGESPLRMWLAPFEGGRARLFAHLLLAWLLLSAASVAATHPALRIDVASLVIVYVALEYAMLRGIAMALLVGYSADVLSGESRCLSMASLVIVFLIVRLVVARITGSRWFMITAVSVFGTVLGLGSKVMLEWFVGPGISTFRAMMPALPAILIG